MQRRLPGGVAKNGRSYITPTRGPYVQRRSGMWIPDASKRHPGFAVLRSATSWYDTRDLTLTAQQTLPNRVNASATAAQLGSTSGSDTNDPLALSHSGTNYVYLPGTVGNYCSAPDSAALDVSGDLTLIVGASGITYGFFSTFVSKLASNAGYRLNLTATGELQVGWGNGSSFINVASTLKASLVAPQPLYWAATVDVDNGAGGYSVRFWYGDDLLNWTQLGSTVTGGTTTTIAANTIVVSVGANASGLEPLRYNLSRLIVASGIGTAGIPGGTTVLDINPATETLGQSSWTCTTGQTVTVNRSTSGLTTAVVTRPLLMADGTDDYIQLPASDTPTFTATTGAYTVMLINRVHNQAGAATLSRVWSSEFGTGPNGALIYLDAASDTYKAQVSTTSGGATTITTDPVSFTRTTQLHAVAAVYNAGLMYAYSTTTGLTTGANYSGIGSFIHIAPRVASRAFSVSLPGDFENYAAVHWTRALTATELNAASAFLLGSYR